MAPGRVAFIRDRQDRLPHPTMSKRTTSPCRTLIAVKMGLTIRMVGPPRPHMFWTSIRPHHLLGVRNPSSSEDGLVLPIRNTNRTRKISPKQKRLMRRTWFCSSPQPSWSGGPRSPCIHPKRGLISSYCGFSGFNGSER